MKKRKALAALLALTLALGPSSMPAGAETGETPANSAAFSDVSGHWAEAAIYKWSGNGIINGYQGLFRPDDSITRGEMAVILDNMMDYQVAAKNTFTDLTAGQFYTDPVLKANAAGIIKGDGARVRPADRISREEAAVMLGRAFAVKESTSGTAAFNDASSVSSWAKGYVTAMAAKGYIKGSNNSFRPKANITRAEIVTIIDNAVKAYYKEAGVYTENVNGTAVIKVTGVTLKGVTVAENLIVAEGVGQGDVTLDSVTVKGETVVRGGGENSVSIVGDSDITTIRIEKIDGKIRITVSDGNTVQAIEIAEGEEIIITGTVGTIEVAAPNTTITANNANIGSINVEGAAANTNIQAGNGAVIGTVNASAQTTVSGQGTVSNVNLNEGANNSNITTPNTKTTVGQGVTGATGGGGTPIPGGSSVTNNSSGTGASTGGSGSGSSTPTLTVSDVTVNSAVNVTFSSIAAPSAVTWNGTAVPAGNIAYNTGTRVATVTVPGISKVTNTLAVSAAGYRTGTVDHSIPVGTYDDGRLKVIDSDSDIVLTVSNAAAGDTILVAAGNYDIEDTRIVIRDGITFAGDGWDKTKIKGTAHRAGGTVNNIVQPMLLTLSASGDTLVRGIHFEWDETGIGTNYYSALSLAGDGITVTECKVTTTTPSANYITIVNIGRSGGNVAGEAGVAAGAVSFTDNIVGGTISVVPSVAGTSLQANISGNTITAVNMEGIWTYCLTDQDELTLEDNTITGVPDGMFDIKLMEKVGSVNGTAAYTSDGISAVNNNVKVLLQYSTRIVDAAYTGVNGVNNCYDTIAAAVAAATTDDAIVVWPGTYQGNVTVDKRIKLLSVSGAASTTIAGIQSGGELGTIFIRPGVNGVEIGGIGQGFTIVGIDSTPGLEKAAVYFQGANSGSKVIGNNIVANGDSGLTTEYNLAVENLMIDHNTFSGKTFDGDTPGSGNQFTEPNVPRQLVVINGGASTAITFTNNMITGIAGGMNASGAEQGNTLVTIDANGATITGNTFNGYTNGGGASLRARGANADISGNFFSDRNPIHMYVRNTSVADVNALIGANTFATAPQLVSAGAEYSQIRQ